MTNVPFQFQQANRFLPHIIIVGIGIGTANYIMNGDLNWMQWAIQSITTSLIVGYAVVLIGLNKPWFFKSFRAKNGVFILVFFMFFLAGILATEVEHLIRSLIFQSEQFSPFTAGKMYLFNGIISLILGYSFFWSDFSRRKNMKSVENSKDSKPKKNDADTLLNTDPILNIPVKQGENILLIPMQEIVYFEAFDNYSFVFNSSGEKKLCDYSLLFLEKRLTNNFSRIHRKYIVNKNHIKQIKPHLNGRYQIVFNLGLDPITSSKGYLATIQKLIKIQ